jgi:hypothetical protein
MKLLPDVEYLKDPALFIWRPRGVLNEKKVNEILVFLTRQENLYGRPFDRFSDLSLLDAVDLSFKYVLQVALYRRLMRVGRETIKSAFFVTTPAIARYIKLHALVTDHSPLVVAMFEDRLPAAEWLGVSPALLIPRVENENPPPAG